MAQTKRIFTEVDEEVHGKFKAKVSIKNKKMNEVLKELILKYLSKK